jgi:ubiquinone/menaquinone biosynthesis C-methylase UbiE
LISPARAYDRELEHVLLTLDEEGRRRLKSQVRHFTLNEAQRRDDIVLGYFGARGIARIVEIVSRALITNGRAHAFDVLDVGSGVGTFTIPIMDAVKSAVPGAAFYATDPTPAMLQVLTNRRREIKAFVGIAEDLEGSAEEARKRLRLPRSFDAIISTLALRHVPDTRRALKSMSGVLKADGRALLVDMCSHEFTEFKEEMGDVHLGFDLGKFRALAAEIFDKVRVRKLPSVCRCSDTGRSADLFFAQMSRRID